ncbi:MAG TPA: response regulator transcription factor [Candidatus Hydrogenedentes bacterium]|nr:response regulator transcription factor [Candidatus Hydrogenedentota bacterium]
MPDTRTIVIVDDHPFVLQGMKAAIEAEEMFDDIQLAATAEEAMHLAEQCAPQVAIVDITLPGMDGIKLTRHLHKRHPEMQILIVSMHNRQNYVIESFRAGARGYVVKQSSTENFLDALRCVAQGNYFVDGSLGMDLATIFSSTSSETSVRDAAYASLSPREQQVMRLLAEGKTCKEIGDELGISSKTADVHRANVLKKLDLDNTVELVRYAATIGLIDLSGPDTL